MTKRRCRPGLRWVSNEARRPRLGAARTPKASASRFRFRPCTHAPPCARAPKFTEIVRAPALACALECTHSTHRRHTHKKSDVGVCGAMGQGQGGTPGTVEFLCVGVEGFGHMASSAPPARSLTPSLPASTPLGRGTTRRCRS